MRIIDYTKTYGDGHSIRFEFNASNAPFVHVDGKLHNPAQLYVEGNFDERKIDAFYKLLFHKDPHDWSSKETIYQEEGDSDIYFGTEIHVIQKKDQEMYYELDYAGRKICHKGIILRMDWQNFLFEKWQAVYGVK